MYKSVSRIIEDHDLPWSNQKMNCLLLQRGYLKWEQGEYSLTEKGMKIGREHGETISGRQDGYPVISFDEDRLLQELGITPETLENPEALGNITDEVSDAFRTVKEIRKGNNKAVAQSESPEPTINIPNPETENTQQTGQYTKYFVLGAIGAIGLGVGIYYLVKHVKKRRAEKQKATEPEDTSQTTIDPNEVDGRRLR